MQKTSAPNFVWMTAILLLCLISRLPQILSPYFHAGYNGDECVLGLMAKHLAEGKGCDFYFWGQKYGFCWVEAGAMAAAIKLFGISLFTLKLPMLLLWSLGCIFLFSSLSQWTRPSFGFCTTCLYIFCPGWLGWSMNARGGYITAFFLTSIVLFFLAHRSLNSKIFIWLLMGSLTGFIFYSQPMYLIGLLPIWMAALSPKKLLHLGVFVLGFAAIFALGQYMAHIQTNTDIWKPSWFRPDPWPTYFSTLPKRLLYILNQDAPVYWPSIIFIDAWYALLGAGILMTIYGLWQRNITVKSLPFLASVVLLLSCTTFINCEDQWRYLLALSLFMPLWFGVLGFELWQTFKYLKPVTIFLLSALMVLGSLTAWNYKNTYETGSNGTSTEMQRIYAMIDFLKSSNVRYVFSLDQDMSWKIDFFSGESILSRWGLAHDRQPAYIETIDDAFFNGEPVAVMGNMADEGAAATVIQSEGTPVMISYPYFAYLNPSKLMVFSKLGFAL